MFQIEFLIFNAKTLTNLKIVRSGNSSPQLKTNGISCHKFYKLKYQKPFKLNLVSFCRLMNQFLIEAVSNHSKKNTDTAISTEMSFLLSSEKKLHLNKNYSTSQISDFLANAIASSPNDLRLHTQRLFHQIELKDNRAVYGALIDLFISLSEKGLPIKKRMLNLAKPFLSAKEVAFIRAHSGLITPKTAIPPTNHSILSLGYSGTSILLKKTASFLIKNSTKALRTAIIYIRKGQLKPAKNLLEKSVLAGNINKETHQKLLDIYIFTKDKTGCKQIQTEIKTTLPINLLALWQASIKTIN